MEKEENQEVLEDPFENLLEEGTEAIVSYVREKGEDWKTKSQRNREK